MDKIYLSASQQPWNVYVGGQFTEEEAMHIYLKDHLAPKLRIKGYDVKVSDPNKTIQENVEEANEWMGSKGLYLAHHTNATGLEDSKNDGTLVLIYGSVKSQFLGKCLYDAIAPVTPTTDEGIRIDPKLYELRKTSSVAALIELFYHDNLEDMKWGITHFDQIADAEIRGIDAYFNRRAA
jgi:N-acetylmuramoyl-L-alanine amidase